MQAIFKRTMLFRGPEGQKLVIAASTELQGVPDWIGDTAEFKLAAKKPSKGIPSIVRTSNPGLAERERLLRENGELTLQVQQLTAQLAQATKRLEKKQ